MKVLLKSFFFLMLMLCLTTLYAGQNENASISVDFNYDQAGNQGVNSIDAPGIDATVYFEVRINNCSKFDTYFFELLYSTDDLTYDAAYTDNVKGDDEENNILRQLNAGIVEAPIDVDASGPIGVITFSRTNDTNDPNKCPSGEGLLGLFRFKTKVAAPKGIQFGRVEWYDVNSVMDLCKEENKGEGFMGGGSLPVKLSSFTASANGDDVLLQWSTESEKDSWGFNVLRSEQADGLYERVNAELIKAAGNSSNRNYYSYNDKRVIKGSTYFYKLEQIDVNGTVTYFGPIELSMTNDAGVTPESYVLYDNFPNPFNPETTFKFELPQEEFVTLDVYNIAGVKILTLISSPYKAGVHTVVWDGRNNNGEKVSSGVYLYKFRAGAFLKNGKMMLLN